jgi:CheY-like chemotaxis protein
LGADALWLLRRSNHFDLAIIDMVMPTMDGITLAREIQNIPEAQTMPLILASSISCSMSESDRERFAARLVKPIKASQLYDVLATVLGKQIAMESPTAQSAEPASPLSDLEARRQLRVLLAEDNLINQKVALKMLDKLGYRADAVANGKEAIEAFKKIPYDVILMDCQMPEVDGYEATWRIRMCEREEQRKPVRVIAMTANAMQGDREQCLSAGMDDYLGKPVRIAELREVLERCLADRYEQSPPLQNVEDAKS